MEEYIKVLEENMENGTLYCLCGNTIEKAVRNLLARNKELEKQMGKDLDVVYLKGVYDERDRWKSKVKEKIDEIHNEPMNYSPDEYWIENECKGYCIDILKELLEKS